MKAEVAQWPFRPIHITNDGETIEDPHRPDLDKLKGLGIISNEHLRGIETTMCANLQKPTTLIEFPPPGEAVEAVRTDSPLLDATPPPCGLLPTCKLLRDIEINGEKCKCCHDCDIVHASLLKGLKIGEITGRVKERINDSGYIQEYKRRNADREMIRLRAVEIHGREKRYCLEYDCPLLGYRETVFPVFFEGRVVAVFFAGQICLASTKGDMVKIQNAFFNSALAPKEVKKRQKEIVRLHNQIVTGDLWDDLKYEDFLKRVCQEVARLENTLKAEMSMQRERRVKERIENQIKELQARFRASAKKGDLCELWGNVGQCMEALRRDFCIRYVIIFGIERPMQQNRQSLGVVAGNWGEDVPTGLAGKIEAKALRYNLDKIPARFRGVPMTSESIPTDNLSDRYSVRNAMIEAIEEFPERFARKKNLIRIFPLPFSEHGSVVVLIGYCDDNPLTSVENRPSIENRPSKKSGAKDEGYLDKNIGIFYLYVLSMLSSILAKAAQENMSASLRVLGHEADQLNFGLEGIRRRYLSDVTKLRRLEGKKLEDVCRDIEGYFGQLNFLFRQSTQAVTELPLLKKDLFWAYREILFKWEDMYRRTARLKKLKFEVFRTWERDPDRPRLYGDKNLLEQLVYSLVSNAVKYCHKGTKIYLDCVKIDPAKNDSPHILTVTNYGRIFDCDSPFELGARGNNVEGVEGLGIGLHNARRIAVAHGGSLGLEQLPNDGRISDFYVPLIGPYIERFSGTDDPLVQRLRKERERLKNAGKYDAIVADNVQYAPRRMQLLKLIRRPTYEVRLRVTIPAKRS